MAFDEEEVGGGGMWCVRGRGAGGMEGWREGGMGGMEGWRDGGTEEWKDGGIGRWESLLSNALLNEVREGGRWLMGWLRCFLREGWVRRRVVRGWSKSLPNDR